MSSTGSYAVPGPLRARTTAKPLVAAIVLGLFVLAAAVSAQRKDITQGFDEVAHVSYVAHIQHSGQIWPALEGMHMLDPRSFQFTSEPNYLNHPPPFYALLALLAPRLEGRPSALLAHRLINVAFAAFGLAALLWLGLAARLSSDQFYAYAVPLACIPVLAPLAGAVNNDNLAFLGGAVATLAVWRVAATNRAGWLAIALIGVVIAGWAKLTGLLLTGTMVAAATAYLLWRQREALPSRWSWTIALFLGFALAAAPYIVYCAQYGSPAPNTPAQIALIANGAHAAGWADVPRQSFPLYLGFFVRLFVTEWMPALGARTTFNDAMLAIPIAALASAAAGVALSLRRIRHRQDTALDLVVVCGAIALTATFALHVTYSYGRYVATGWLMDAYPRYYLPLAAIVPLAGLSLLAAIEYPRARGGLLAFLICGPILFRIFGGPFN